MDFLRMVIGPSNEEVRRLAVPVQVGSAPAITLHVMHPLLCLASRLHNLKALEAKRKGNGPMQARWAIAIAKSYIADVMAKRGAEQAAKACRMVAEQAEYQAGPFCYVEFGLDPLEAISPELLAAISGQFAGEEWPRTVDRIEGKRVRWKAIAARRAARAKPG